MATRFLSRDNTYRAIFFQKPDHIPVNYAINASYFFSEDIEDVLDLQERHPLLFPGFVRPKDSKAFLESFRLRLPPVARKDIPFVDDFGCTWESVFEGMTGTVTKHPLDDPAKFASYKFPDPEVCMGIGPIDWAKIRASVAARKATGAFVTGGLRHGHTYLQLTDICGYQNFLFYMKNHPFEAPYI